MADRHDFQVGEYLTDGSRLYYVEGIEGEELSLENCSTGHLFSMKMRTCSLRPVEWHCPDTLEWAA